MSAVLGISACLVVYLRLPSFTAQNNFGVILLSSLKTVLLYKNEHPVFLFRL